MHVKLSELLQRWAEDMRTAHSGCGPADVPQAAAKVYMHCNTIGRAVRFRCLENAMFTSLVLSKIRQYLQYRSTIRELSQLSDRELDDIGVARFQIESIARHGVVA